MGDVDTNGEDDVLEIEVPPGFVVLRSVVLSGIMRQVFTEVEWAVHEARINGMSVTDIAEMMETKQPTISKTLNRINRKRIAAGLDRISSRDPKPERRVRVKSLSSIGGVD